MAMAFVRACHLVPSGSVNSDEIVPALGKLSSELRQTITQLYPYGQICSYQLVVKERPATVPLTGPGGAGKEISTFVLQVAVA